MLIQQCYGSFCAVGKQHIEVPGNFLADTNLECSTRNYIHELWWESASIGAN